MFSFKRADINKIADIRRLAEETWPAAYESIIGKEQVNYMLGLMYSEEALKKQFSEGHYFYFIYQSEELAGFCSFGKINSSVWKLFKIYILPSVQGNGAGRKFLDFIIRKVKSLGAEELVLNVNRRNTARFFYEKIGFRIIEDTDIEIGNGYFMNDHVMSLSLSAYE